MNSTNFLVIDFDSTFVKLEALEEIAREALKDNPNKNEIQEKIEEITKKGMRGEISFAESLRSRLKLFSASREEVEKVAQKMRENISDSFLENKDFLEKNNKQIFVISGGFKQCIFLVSDYFKIPRENILANEFVFDNQGMVSGINEGGFMTKAYGKVKQMEALDLKGMIFAVGDGWTDYEIKREEEADYFLAYTENVSRKNVIDLADKKVENFGEVIKFIENTDDKQK